MDIKTIIIGGLLGLSVLFGGLYATKPTTAPTVGDKVSDNGKYGALAGPDIPFNYISVGGLPMYATRAPLNIASTTSCAIQAPASTSTLQYAGFSITGGNQVSVTANMTTGAAMQSSTTALTGNFTVPAAGTINVLASTTNSEAIRVLAPGAWIQVNVFGGSGVSSSTGTCSAEFYVM